MDHQLHRRRRTDRKSASKSVIQAIFIFLISIAPASPILSQEKEIRLERIPGSIEEFIRLRDSLASTPEGGAAVTMAALMAMGTDRSLGLQMLTIALAKENVTTGNVYRGFAPSGGIMYHINRLSGRSVNPWTYLPFAYVKGTDPANDYRITPPYSLIISRNRFSGEEAEGKVKVFIRCFGVSPRPMTMKRNESGVWKSYEISSMFLDVQPPASSAPKDEL